MRERPRRCAVCHKRITRRYREIHPELEPWKHLYMDDSHDVRPEFGRPLPPPARPWMCRSAKENDGR